jgi:hypothetical protein
MTLRLSAVISADASQAKAALAQTTAGAKEAAGALDGLGAAGGGIGPKVIPPLQQLPPLMDRTASSTNAAAGSMGNLVANFNDIGMMMAAGQNPLMLAIQQGTQITQVIGPMGATGALRAMGGALVSMFSPMNIITLGVIAFGAAAVQWFTAAGEEAATLDDRIADLEGSVGDLRDAVSLSMADMRDEFGSVSPAIMALRDDLRELAMEQTLLDAQDAARGLRETLSGTWLRNETGQIADLLNVPIKVYDAQGPTVNPAINSFEDQVNTLINSDDTRQQLEALDAIQARLQAVKASQGEWTEEQRTFYRGTLDIERQLQVLVAVQDQLIGSEAEANAQLQSQIADLNQEAQIRALIAQYGAESVQVAEARAAAERAAYVEMVNASDASQANKDAAIAAWDAAKGIASAGMAGNIGAAASEAQRLAQNLGISLDVAQRLAAAQARAANPDPVVFDPRDPRYDPIAAEQARILADPNRGRTQASLTVGSKGGSGSAGGGGGGGAESDAVQALIDRYQNELDLLQELDPVQQQMLRNRAALAEATEPQRQAVEGLIRTLEREKEIAESRDAGADALNSYFMKVANGANAAQTAVDMLLDSLLKAVIQGEGPLAGLLGTKGTSLGSMILGGGGLFGGLLGGGKGAFFGGGRADGGMIHGFGGGRDDRVMIAASPGEMMINARATSRNRALLEFINGGGEVGIPGFANGGMIGGSGARGGAFAAPAQAGPTFSIDARGSSDPAEVERAARRGMQAALTEYSRSGLPRDLQRIQANPMRVG